MAQRRFGCVTLALAGALATPSAARACVCKPVWPLERAFDRSAVVFEGRAGEGREDAERTSIRTDFEVLRVFKGEACPTVEIVTLGSSSSCSKRYDAAETYLIYAYERDGELRDGYCARSRPAPEAKKDLAQLGPDSPPACEATVETPNEDAAPTPDAEGAPPARANDDPPSAPPEPVATPEPDAGSPKQRGCAATTAGAAPEGAGGLIVLLLAAARWRRRSR